MKEFKPLLPNSWRLFMFPQMLWGLATCKHNRLRWFLFFYFVPWLWIWMLCIHIWVYIFIHPYFLKQHAFASQIPVQRQMHDLKQNVLDLCRINVSNVSIYLRFTWDPLCTPRMCCFAGGTSWWRLHSTDGLDSDKMFGDVPGNFTEGSGHCELLKTVEHPRWLCFCSATIFSNVSFHTLLRLQETGDHHLTFIFYKTFAVMWLT